MAPLNQVGFRWTVRYVGLILVLTQMQKRIYFAVLCLHWTFFKHANLEVFLVEGRKCSQFGLSLCARLFRNAEGKSLGWNGVGWYRGKGWGNWGRRIKQEGTEITLNMNGTRLKPMLGCQTWTKTSLIMKTGSRHLPTWCWKEGPKWPVAQQRFSWRHGSWA